MLKTTFLSAYYQPYLNYWKNLYYADSTKTSYLENGFRIINSDFVQLTPQYSSVTDSHEK
jgi:hypothetical protein